MPEFNGFQAPSPTVGSPPRTGIFPPIRGESRIHGRAMLRSARRIRDASRVGGDMLFYLLSFWSVGIAFLCALYVSRTLRERRASAGVKPAPDDRLRERRPAG